ncbi:MAG TPA: protein kinase, partial [Candidatus Eisenbacteria bacterium]|nr:protein kinase [Candidatus Eisenbacteria bacterium]
CPGIHPRSVRGRRRVLGLQADRHLQPPISESCAVVGRKIGRFLVLAKLGQGGMATVWKARDELLGREVALKILDEKLAHDDKSRRRFLHEARTAASLDHPGAVAVFDSGESEGIAYIAMRLVEGETLAERIDRSLLPIEEAIRIAIAVGEVLAQAHQRGVVHRDISSRNVMIGRDGRVFVLDFGLALANWESRISSTGTTLGTVPYMAPEVLLSQDADARSDLYGLGVVLYEALTGTVPHGREHSAASAYTTIHGEPISPRNRRPEISEALEHVVLKSIAREPGARHQSAEDLVRELRAVDAVESDPRVVHAPRAATQSREARDPSEVTRPHPLYLAIRPVTVASIGDDREEEAEASARHLTDSLASALSRYNGVRIVPSGAHTANGDEPREIARSLGANAVLASSISRSGSRLRVAYQILDPWRDVMIAGDVIEGSIGQLFDLADQVVRSVAQALELRQPDSHVVARPRDPAARERFQQALGYLKRYDHEASVDGAIRLLEGLVASESDVAPYHAALARAYLHKYEIGGQRSWEAKAADACERARRLDPDASDTHVALGELQLAGGRGDAAILEFEKAIAGKPGQIEAWLGILRAHDRAGRAAEAEEAGRQALVREPSDWRVYSRLGNFHFRRGRFDSALQLWQKAVELAPDSARGQFNVGSALYRLDRFEEAVRAYQASIEIHPNPLAYTNLGTALYYLGRQAEAVLALRKAVELNPLDPIVWGNLGSSLRGVPGGDEHAEAALEEAIALMRERLDRNPSDADGWARLGGWLANRGQEKEAISAVERALALAPDDAFCLVRAGHVYFQQGRREDAVRALGEAVRRGYGVKELERSQELAPLRQDAAFRRLLGGMRTN